MSSDSTCPLVTESVRSRPEGHLVVTSGHLDIRRDLRVVLVRRGLSGRSAGLASEQVPADDTQQDDVEHQYRGPE